MGVKGVVLVGIKGTVNWGPGAGWLNGWLMCVDHFCQF